MIKGLLALFGYEKRASSLSGSHPRDPALAELFGGAGTSSGQNVNSDTAMRVSAVYACVTVLSQTLAMLPLDIKKLRLDGGKDIAISHRLYKQLKYKPNRWQTSFEWREMMEGHRLLRGNAYSLITSTPGRGINELVPLHPDCVFPFVTTPQGVSYYMSDMSPPPEPGSVLRYEYYPGNGQRAIADSSEMLHIRDFSINGIVGMGRIKQARESIGLAMAAEQQGNKLFSNGMQITGVYEHPSKLTDEQVDRIKKSISQFEGSQNAFKTMVLEGGMKFNKVSMTPEDSQFIEARKFQIEDIARMFHVPLILIGHGDKAPTFASAEQFMMSFKTHTMQPNVVRWEEGLGAQLLYPSELGSVAVDFDLDELLRADAAARIQYLKGRFETASITPDEIRVYEGENPTGTEEGKQYYLQSGMMPANQAGQGVPNAQNN